MHLLPPQIGPGRSQTKVLQFELVVVFVFVELLLEGGGGGVDFAGPPAKVVDIIGGFGGLGPPAKVPL